MKVAIIGAGISGLACALELEKHNISPVIYEKKSIIGESYQHAIGIINISHRPIKDPLEFLNNYCGIDLKPLNKITTIIHKSAHITRAVKSDFGYFLNYSTKPDSVRNQLYAKCKKTRLILSHDAGLEELIKEYDWVVVATGSYSMAQQLGIWQERIKTHLIGAEVEGNFDPCIMQMWLNTEYCKNGYAYLTPLSAKRASLVLVLTDTEVNETDRFWQLFLHYENIQYRIVSQFKLEHRAGYVYPMQVKNMILTGNAGGGVDPYLGFGFLNAIIMGTSAARTIAEGSSYYKQVEKIIKRNNDMYMLRKMFNRFTNNDLDKILIFITLPGFKQMLYDTNINISKYASLAARFLIKGNKKTNT